jgi:hypothetical protein
MAAATASSDARLRLQARQKIPSTDSVQLAGSLVGLPSIRPTDTPHMAQVHLSAATATAFKRPPCRFPLGG